MYAVVELGGQQYIVKKDDTIVVDRVEKAEGESFDITTVVCAFDNESYAMVWAPYVKGGVTFKVKEHIKGEKVHITKFQGKKRYERNKWFRPYQSVLVVENVAVNGK